MEIIKKLVSETMYDIKCPYPMKPEFIVVHNTANDSTAMNEINYMITNAHKTSFHYAIDDKNIIQGIPDNRNAFHAGDGVNGIGNRKGLSIEICYSKSGGEKFDKAEQLAAKFIAYKLKEYGWDISKVKKHQDFSGKYCPHRTLDLGWNRFLNMVSKEYELLLKGGIEVEDKNTPSTWAKEAWEWAKKEKITDGTRPKENITREEVIVMIYRALKVKK
jgi:N-acetylmuramoyl-L-alanine amidase CwlA